MKHAGLVVLGVLLTAPVHAQPPAGGQALGLAASIQRGYNNIKMNLTQSADKLGDADYGYKVGSMAETRTFGQLFAHVIQSQSATCAAVRGVANPFQGRQLEQELKTKAEITKALAESFALCDDAYASLTDQNALEMVKQGQGTIARAAALANNVSHDNEMYGTSAAYLRSKGIVPPSTERQTQGRGAGAGRGAPAPPPGR
jgi:DinB superfamily